MLQDIRSGIKVLWHSKAFATVAILCLGFGIGLNTTIFSIVDGVLLKPFPYQDPDRLVLIRASNEKQNIEETSVSLPDLNDIRTASQAFADSGTCHSSGVL